MEALDELREWVLAAIAVILVVAVLAGYYESFIGLRAWALGHDVGGTGSYVFPAMIDTFPLMAEGWLIVAMGSGWSWKERIPFYVVIALAQGLSIALNVGAVHSSDWATLATHAMFPMAAFMALAVGVLGYELTLFHRLQPVTEEADEPEMDDEPEPADELEIPAPRTELPLDEAVAAFKAELEAGRVPGLNRIRRTVRVGHDKAPKIQQHLKALTQGGT